MSKNGKIITFFNHKGGVGKTTLVFNIGTILADKGFRVLLIDADPQMNLTAAMYGLSNSIDYSTDEDSVWTKNTGKYISLTEFLNRHLKDQHSTKGLFRKSGLNEGYVDLISGSITLYDIEADLYGLVKNKNQFTESIPYKFEQAIRKMNKEYDFILIDTSPSASSIVNALIMMGSDYFIAPVAPSFFSLQAIDNLSSIFNNWTNLLGGYETTQSYKGLSFKPKFLGLVVQMAKRFSGGNVKEKINEGFSRSADRWVQDLNNSVKRFQKWALERDKSISSDEFINLFLESEPFIIAKCCDFTPQLKSIAERAGVPVVKLTPEICTNFRDSRSAVDITKEKGQYTRSFQSIVKSYNNVADGLIRLQNA